MYLIKEGSQSLIGTLSKEVDTLRKRSRSILISIIKSKDKSLILRLNNEFRSIERRRREILIMATYIRDSNILDELSIDFLIEISKRPANPLSLEMSF